MFLDLSWRVNHGYGTMVGMNQPADPTARLVSDLRADLPHTLIALDFDGTLAPIVPDPADSRPLSGTVEALGDLAGRGARLAVITGRDAATLLSLSGFASVPGLVVLGLYGAEEWHDGHMSTPDTPTAMLALQQRLPELVDRVATDPKVWIEDKRLSLVVHGRLSTDPEGALDPLREPVRELAADLDLELHPGKGVLELRLPGFDKGAALDRLVARYEPAAVLYVGDDLGDVPALAATRALRVPPPEGPGLRAWAVASGTGDAPPPDEVRELADLVLPGPHEVVELLAALAIG